MNYCMCLLILRHLANVSLSFLDNVKENSWANHTRQTLCQSCALPSKHEELRHAGPEAIFHIGDVIRTWQISQSSVAVRLENLDVKYYRFDYQFYNRTQLGNFLLVLYIKCSNSSLRSWVTAGIEEEKQNKNHEFRSSVISQRDMFACL